MPRYVTNIDIEEINRTYYELQQLNPHGFVSLQEVANKTGWSKSTVKKYLSNNYKPPKAIKEKIQKRKENNEFAGLYLMIMEAKDYFIKVGQSKNIAQRLKQYKTENPLAKCIDTLPCRENELNQKESFFHKQLNILGEQVEHTEWYKISKKDLDKIKNHKFNKPIWIEMGSY